MFRIKELLLASPLLCGLVIPSYAQFLQQGPKLVTTDAAGNAEQGYSVALSADGNTALIGAPGDSGGIGSAWVFTRADGVWTQQGPTLTGTGVSGPVSCQGTSVALSGDGNTALVGGPCDGGNAGVTSNVGAAWVFARSGGVWSQQGPKLVGSGAVPGFFGRSSIGASVSLSTDGNTAVLGGPDDNKLGAAWVFTRSAGVWNQLQPKLVGSGAIGGYGQGSSVAISGDGSTILTAAPTDGTNPGAVWIFVNGQGGWTQESTVMTGVSLPLCLKNCGQSVSLSADGNTALAGEGDGALILERSGSTWSVLTKLVGYGQTGAGNPLSGSISMQGASVSLSADGNTVVVGGPSDDTIILPGVVNTPSSIGAAWVFHLSGGLWAQVGSKLVGSDMTDAHLHSPGVQQGFSVAVSADGTTVLSGGPGDAQGLGAGWVFITNSPSTTLLSALPNPAIAGQRVVFTAKVTAGAAGTVTFTMDGVLLAEIPLSGGIAQMATTLSGGSHKITAAYSGGANYQASTSDVLVEMVKPRPAARRPSQSLVAPRATPGVIVQ